jgi:Protein of unknown function (DUF3800)
MLLGFVTAEHYGRFNEPLQLRIIAYGRRPSALRYRLFFDETDAGDLRSANDPNQRYLSLTGIVIRQDFHDGYTTRRLDRLKRDIFGQSPTNVIVLHRRDLIDRKGIFAPLADDQIRKEFDARIAALIAKVPAPAFTVSIDKLAHKNKYKVWQFNPYHYVLTCLVERFVRWLNRTGNLGDVMGEARGPTHDAQLRLSFRRLHNSGSSFVPASMVQRCLISKELILRPKTANVAGLQLADLLAHPAHRAFRIRVQSGTHPHDYGTFLARMLDRYIYDRVGAKIDGIGRKWLP